jgi:hypothetical protein
MTTGFTVCAVRTDKLSPVSQLVNPARDDRYGKAGTDRPTSNSLRNFAIFVPIHSANLWSHRSVTGVIQSRTERNSWPKSYRNEPRCASAPAVLIRALDSSRRPRI